MEKNDLLFEKTLSHKEIFNGRVLHVFEDQVELPNKHTSSREIIEHPGGVCIAALTENNELLLVKQFRYPYKEVILEVPAGKLEKNQTPLENGIRELEEETGAIGENFISLGEMYPSPGYSSEILYMFFCNVKEIKKTNFDVDEFLEIHTIPLEKCVEMVLNNEIHDAKSQLVILKTYYMLKNKKLI
ncbi:MAG: NUDIX hydrolase [Clostridia bacterium]|nr:NUDIX hydrolase [Clostridia bacterium]